MIEIATLRRFKAQTEFLGFYVRPETNHLQKTPALTLSLTNPLKRHSRLSFFTRNRKPISQRAFCLVIRKCSGRSHNIAKDNIA